MAAMWPDSVRGMLRAVLAVVLPFWLASQAAAQGSGDVAGARDFSGVARFPGQRLCSMRFSRLAITAWRSVVCSG